MFYNNCYGYQVANDVGQNTILKDIFISTPQNTICQNYLPTRNYIDGRGVDWLGPYGGNVSNITLVNNRTGFYQSSTGLPTLTNVVFFNNGTAITNDPGHSYSDFYGNTSNGTTLVATDKTVNPGYDTTTYGTGAYLFVPATSPLKGAGANGADIGANIIYEYIDGQLTNTPLWPWPMESRIMAEKGISATWASSGGIWKTLTGVYPGTTPTPTSALTPTPTPSSQGTNLLQNPSFETGIPPWGFYLRSDTGGTALGTLTQDSTTASDGNYSAKVNITQAGPQVYYTNLNEGPISLTGGQSYTIEFWAKADTNRQIQVAVQENYSPWSTYTTQNVNISTTWQKYTYTYTQPTTDTNVEFLFNFGQQTGTVWFDNVNFAASQSIVTPTLTPTPTNPPTPSFTPTPTPKKKRGH